ncbi:MAG: S1/P1 Nuclease [Bacteroidetes bacterium]|nr:MAG: S1/P1 Nuclease [Bacteroidota bacterium]
MFKTLFVLGFISAATIALGWGFFGHKRINRMTVFTLPPELFGFYKAHIEFLTEHAPDPDKRRYAVEGEAPRHFIDIDHYDKENPFAVVPRKWEDAVAKFTEDTLMAYGIVPWHIEVMVKRLTYAFKNKDLDRILKLSAELGHYVGDAHVPLHTTENYNGQMTGQKGIHGFWESRLPELFAEDYDYFVGKAEYIADINDFVWTVIEESHAAVDSVLLIEKQLTEEFPSDRKYSYETRGNITIKTYSRDFSQAFHERLNGMVERRMRKSIIAAGSLIYTAWLNAGQPDLEELKEKQISEETLLELQALDDAVKKGKIKGREHSH